VKIEPANIGVGLYQHDVKARHLNASLDAVVESCVNYVGVDANTASPALLRYVSGLNQTMAKGFQEWRAKNGAFTSRAQFLEVPGFGEAAHVQAAGFLKITGGSNPFDSTWIHPESYEVAAKVLERLGGTSEDLANRQRAGALAEKAAALDLPSLAEELGVGRLLLSDIVDQLARPGRDPREDLPQPFFKKGVLKLEDLQLGMELHGAVLNVVDFGAFVDIGLHDSGMVHISQLSRKFVGDPHDIVSVGQIVKVWVLEIDKNRRRVALTMIQPGSPDPRDGGRGPRGRRGQQGQAEGGAPAEGSTASRPPRRRPEGAQGQQPAGGGQPAGGRSEQGRGRGGDQGRPPRASSSTGGAPAGGGRSQGEGGRSPRSLGGRRDQQRPSQPAMGRVYESKKTGRDAAPITKAQIEGKEPLRTFGALKQLFTTLNDPPVAEPVPAAKPEKAKRKPAPEAPETPVTGATDLTGGEVPPAQVPTPAPEAPSEPAADQSDPPAV
jgi:uncharacterized protein